MLDDLGAPLLEFFVPGEPRTQGSKTQGIRKDGSPYMRENKTGQWKQWRETVEQEAFIAGRLRRLTPDDRFAPFFLQITFRLGPRPKTIPPSRLFKTTTPDVDKLVRAVLDGLTGQVYKDDCQVVGVLALKDYGTPGAEIKVWRLTDRSQLPV